MKVDDKKEYEDDEFLEINKQRINYFFKSKTVVHCSLKDGSFYNGLIFSVSDDLFEIHDRVLGVQLVFFMELKKRVIEFTEAL